MKTKAQLQKEIETLRKKLGMKEESKQDKLIPTGKFTLEIVDTKTKETIHRFENLSEVDCDFYRKDLYRLIVVKMKKKISMSKIAEFKKVGSK